MKTFLSFIVTLFLTFLCKAFRMQGFECFCHDTPNVPLINNNCFINIIQLFQGNLFNLPNSSYSWNLNGVLQPNIVLNRLQIQQQATLAITRFCIGITNNRPLPAFQNLRALFQAYLGNGVQNNIQRALMAGGYNTPSAQFLHALFMPGGIPLGIVFQNGQGQPNNAVSIILKLQRRVSKDLKEIHWSSSSVIAVNPNLWYRILHEVIQQNAQQLQQLLNANQNFLNLLPQNVFLQFFNAFNVFQQFLQQNVPPFNAFRQFLQQNAPQLLNANQNLLNLLQQQQNAQPQLLALQQLLNEQRLFLNAPQPQYVSIKQRIDMPFNILNQNGPHSATFVLYDETSLN